MEEQLKLTGTLTTSPAGMQPRAYLTRGKSLYHLECSVSGMRTAKLKSLQEAVEHWERIAGEAMTHA